jgi:ABC-2 type transport system ATP-binding protein
MEEAEYCHRLALMYRGRVIALGSPQSLKDELRSHHILELISSDLFESLGVAQTVPGVLDVAVFGGGLHITVESEADAIPRITSALGERGISVERIEPIEPTMEDVFVAMIEAADREQKPA